MKFFGKIRKFLLSEGKFKQYFKYAIGEIILVVIGILIALQVNNLNENGKNRAFEEAMLKNIQDDIVLDTIDLAYNIDIHKRAILNQKLLLRLINKDSTVKVDSINFSEALSSPLILTLHASAFNNLFTKPNLILNQELRKRIERHYNFFYSSLIELENQNNDYNFYTKLMPYFKKYFKGTGPAVKTIIQHGEEYNSVDYERSSLKLRNLMVLQNDSELAFDLSETIYLRTILVSFYEEVMFQTKKLHTEIDSELKK